jgi:Na+/proline symporter
MIVCIGFRNLHISNCENFDLFNTLFLAEVFIPIFYNLNVRSTYEYLEMRFNKTLRTTTMILFIIAGVMSMGVAIYAPATAISAVTSMENGLTKF